ncbi:MAG: hypothetical protein Q4A60_05850 [Pasteurellaceae bacterium]|nr:hypothetical protein [Pasteurellaceae bacterium]
MEQTLSNLQGVTSCEESAKSEPDLEFIRLQEVMKLFDVSRATFDRWQRPDSPYYLPDFPKKIKIGNFSFYVRSEIRDYMQKLVDQRENG